MLVRLFNSSQPSTLLLIPLVGILLWSQNFLGTPIEIDFPFDYHQMPLYKWIKDLIPQNIFSSILALLCIILQAFWLARINSKHWLIKERTYLPAILYVVLASGCPFLLRLHPILLGNFFFIWSLDMLFSSYKKRKAMNYFFNASLGLAIASLFYAPYAYFLPFIILSLFILRGFFWREFVSIIFGFLAPYVIYSGYLFVFSEKWVGVFNNLLEVSGNLPTVALNISYYIYFGFILLLAFISVFYLLVIKYVKISTRRYFEVLFSILAFTILFFFIFKTISYEILIIFSIAFSFILTNYIISLRSKLLSNAIFLLFIGVLVYVRLSL